MILGWPNVSLWAEQGEAQAEKALWILGMALLIGVVSFWDDRVGLPPSLRFGVQGVTTVGVVGGAGLKVHAVTVPILGTMSLGWAAVPLTILFLMWMINLYNFMDGMDGFAGGMTILGFGFLSYLAWKGGHQFLAALSLFITGAAGGFLFHNMPPARIFMGDVGSISLGFLAGTLAVGGVHDGLFDIWVPVLIFSPFLVDATVTLFRRLLRGEKVWQAHREHYYQRLVLAGWGHRKTVLVEYCVMIACGINALLYLEVKDLWRLILLLGWVIIYSLLAYSVRVLEERYAEQHRGKL